MKKRGSKARLSVEPEPATAAPEPTPEPEKKYEGSLKRYEVIGHVGVTGAGAQNMDGKELTGLQTTGTELYMDPKSDFTKRFIDIGVIK